MPVTAKSRVKAAAPDVQRISAENAVESLSALAQATRLSIFRALVQAGREGIVAGNLAKRLDLAPSALSFHLKSLVAAQLVTAVRDGRFIYYFANFPAMHSLLGFLTENCCAGLQEK